MRLLLHIGLPGAGTDAIQTVLAENRGRLLRKGICFSKSLGAQNHARLAMAITDPDHVDPLRFYRALAKPQRQAALRKSLLEDLQSEIAQTTADVLIVSAWQLAWIWRPSELERLKGLLQSVSDDIRILAHVADPGLLALRNYADQVFEGRTRGLDLELSLGASPDWWAACLETAPAQAPHIGDFVETQSAPFWLDYQRLIAFWDGTFGAGALTLRAMPGEDVSAEALARETEAAFDIPMKLSAPAPAKSEPPSAATLARGRQYNALLARFSEEKDLVITRLLRRQMLNEMAVAGPESPAGALSALTDRFAAANAALADRFGMVLDAPEPSDPWQEADPQFGFRPAQYLLHNRWRIEKSVKVRRAAEAQRKLPDISTSARNIMPERAIENYEVLKTSRFAPHNLLGRTQEAQEAEPYSRVAPRPLPKGSSGKVIVGCMKNEAPYILEWVAYHRSIGVDNFLIYTNGCEDGTDEILGRLQSLGILHHRLNDDWKGKSPQQYALNLALKEPVIKQADWLIHIDVDEFINVRCGNGTLDDFLDQVGDATSVAMTWRLFGHNGVERLEDRPVIEQFDTCAPKFCPKPHTVWGFKTMLRNNGAYAKLSCHRPNKLDPDWKDRVRWVNGSGADITAEMAERGWRSSMRSIGYDLLQLNHYALRSAESFLIKRQRGRALHVDRSIGLNYWIRMDWSVHRDQTIKRNLPRLNAEMADLMADPVLRDWHQKGLAWHRAKAHELRQTDEFRDLFERVQQIELSEAERVAYSLALDMES